MLDSLVRAVLIALLVSSCTDQGNAPQLGSVSVSVELRCAIDMDVPNFGFQEIPDNCAVTPVKEAAVETDQSIIHLSGRSFAAKGNNCSAPAIGDPPCFPVVPEDYLLNWRNLSNGTSGTGSVAYNVIGTIAGLGPGYFMLSTNDGTVGWNSYNSVEAPPNEPTGIRLEMGPNIIQISAARSDTTGSAEFTVVRIHDTTPPTVHSVLPEPGGTFGFQLVVNFYEILATESMDRALEVTDRDGQPVAGSSTLDSRALRLSWRPTSPLLPNSNYSARLSGVRDLAGNIMVTPYVWSFRTL